MYIYLIRLILINIRNTCDLVNLHPREMYPLSFPIDESISPRYGGEGFSGLEIYSG